MLIIRLTIHKDKLPSARILVWALQQIWFISNTEIISKGACVKAKVRQGCFGFFFSFSLFFFWIIHLYGFVLWKKLWFCGSVIVCLENISAGKDLGIILLELFFFPLSFQCKQGKVVCFVLFHFKWANSKTHPTKKTSPDYKAMSKAKRRLTGKL